MKIRQGRAEAYQKGRDGQHSLYGEMVYVFAERWAELMEKDIDSSGDPVTAIEENARKREREADTDGITGFMYGYAVNILAQCWEYGEILRRWHNKQYRYKGEGVVNPAVITVSPKED